MKHSALEYAAQACEAIMTKYSPQELPPKGSFLCWMIFHRITLQLKE